MKPWEKYSQKKVSAKPWEKYSQKPEDEGDQQPSPDPEQYLQQTSQLSGSLPRQESPQQVSARPEPIWSAETGEVVPENIKPYYSKGMSNLAERPFETLFPMASSMNKPGIPIPFTKSPSRPGDKRRFPMPAIVKRNLMAPLDIASWPDRAIDYASGGAFERGHKTIDEMVPGENIASQTAQGLLKAATSPSTFITGSTIKKAISKPTQGTEKGFTKMAEGLAKDQKSLMGKQSRSVSELKTLDDLTLEDIQKGKAKNVQQATGDIASSEPVKKGPGLPFKKDLSEAEQRIMIERKAPETISFTDYGKQSALAKADTRAITPQQLAGKNASKAFEEVDALRREAGKRIDDAISSKPDATIDISDVKKNYYDMVEDMTGIGKEQKKVTLFDASGKEIPTIGQTKKVVSDPAAISIHNDIVKTLKEVPDIVDASTAQRLKQNLRAKLKQDPSGQLRLKNSRMDAIQKKVSSQIDTKLDDVLGEDYTLANELYRKTAKLEDAFSRALGAEFVPGSGLTKHGASIMKRALQSTADSNVGDIFREVKKLTNGEFDLFQDASYASIAMRLSGDPTQYRKAMPFGGLIKSTPGKGGGDIARGIEAAAEAAGKVGEKATGGKLRRVQKWYSDRHGVPETIDIKPKRNLGPNLNSQRGSVGVDPQTKTENFKKWFGDYEKAPEKASKVVDESGKPLVVYHGTSDNFNAFDVGQLGRTTKAESAKKGLFFTKNKPLAEYYSNYSLPKDIDKIHDELMRLEKIANRTENKHDIAAWQKVYDEYDEAMFKSQDSEQGARVLDTYLSIDNPLIHDYKGEPRGVSYSDVIDDALEKNNNGVIFKNTYDGFGEPGSSGNPLTDIFVAFSPNQIKSATGNSGKFSKLTDDIRGSAALKTMAGAGGLAGAGLAGMTIGESLRKSKKRNK